MLNWARSQVACSQTNVILLSTSKEVHLGFWLELGLDLISVSLGVGLGLGPEQDGVIISYI